MLIYVGPFFNWFIYRCWGTGSAYTRVANNNFSLGILYSTILYFELNSPRRHILNILRIEPADYAVYVEQFERKDSKSAS
jgi:hypothetical protein